MTHSSNLITIPSSYIGEIKGIFINYDSVDVFYISYTRTQYETVPIDNLETLFLESDHENKCWKNKNKSVKRKYDRQSHYNSLDKIKAITLKKEEE